MDGLSNALEREIGTNANNADTDGLTNREEVNGLDDDPIPIVANGKSDPLRGTE